MFFRWGTLGYYRGYARESGILKNVKQENMGINMHLSYINTVIGGAWIQKSGKEGIEATV